MRKKILFLLFICLFGLTDILKSQVTIGMDKSPEGGAILDMKEFPAGDINQTSTKGVIYPRVELSEVHKDDLHPMYDVASAEYINHKDALKKSHTGLVVYNVTISSSFMPGLYCWNGTTWRKMDDSPAVEAGISQGKLLCANATMSPATYTAGQQLVDYYLKVPYMGGNGGVYEGAPPVAGTNGLSIERIGGKLAYGSGEVVYRVTGEPTASSPATATFPIDFLGESCHATVGAVSSVNMRMLEAETKVSTLYLSNPSGSQATELKFGDLVIEETGSYAFSLRLYGEVSYKGDPMRMPYYIFLQKNDKNTVLDAAEIDLIVTSATDYSYSITLGGLFEAGDKVIISMHKPSSTDGWKGPDWKLRINLTNPDSPVRTSLIYWKI